ncbi:hypothetical protein [Streptomyces sp. NPDC055055]
MVIGSAPADLHAMKWAEIPVPGDFCDAPGLVHFDDIGESRANSRTRGQVHLHRGDGPVYGDLDGDGKDEAALTVSCNNGSDTGAGDLIEGSVVFTRLGGQLISIGTLTPQHNPPEAGNCTRIGKVELTPQRITVEEHWYRQTDSTCCPTGKATTVWTREGDRLVPGPPRITS